MKAIVRSVPAALLLAMAGSAWSQGAAQASPEAERLYTRSLAATCAHCHGTDGQAVQSESMARLAGKSRDALLRQLMAFRSGERKATVMNQIAKGYSEQQLAQLAAYFAAQK